MGLGPSDGTWNPRSPDLVKEPGTPNAFVLQADCPKQEKKMLVFGLAQLHGATRYAWGFSRDDHRDLLPHQYVIGLDLRRQHSLV